MSNFYVYGWYNEDWERWFYIGKGTGDRYKQLNGRGKNFLEIVSSFRCTPKILADTSSELMAIETERKLKKILLSLGEPIVDFENNNSLIRQREGIELAKKAGKYKGRKPIEIDEKLFEELYHQWKNGDTQPKYMIKKLGLSRNTFYRRVKAYEEKHGIIKSEK